MAATASCVLFIRASQTFLKISNRGLTLKSSRKGRQVFSRVPKAVLTESEARKKGYDSPFIYPMLKDGTTPLLGKVMGEISEKTKVVSRRELNENDMVVSKFEDVPPYERLDSDNKVFTSVMMMVKSKKERQKHKKILLEGKRLIKDAIEAGVAVESVFFTKEDLVIGLGLNGIKDVKLYKVAYKDMKIWSDLTTAPGVMAVCKKPTLAYLHSGNEHSLPVTVLCDNIREPGNLGAILRCAVASGCQKILTTTGCVDTWNPKVLRGGAGAHFRIPIYDNISWPYIRNYLPDSFNVILADNQDNAEEDIKESKLNIPKKKMQKRNSQENMDYIKKMEDGRIKDTSFENEDKLLEYSTLPFPVTDYHQSVFSSDNIVLVVGGETEGVSAAAYKLAHDNDGTRAHIPLFNGIESLNAATAIAILLFEMRRQMNERKK